ncbi:Hypothetical predicted protein [Cloeon dipterum]|uniref:BTB domain-containing protein n=1 Tax=Cloeon dipterum TaxID=197152 RepID=A0A8S1BYW6_9INSE|nr:Hypothetical predicted protein [Cloeon dipterum]
MRYIYGDAENFQTVSIACEVYEFARLYMIEDVMHAAAKKMKAAAPHEILQVYETFKYLDKSDELKDALKTIARNTNEVLSSPQWVEAAPSTVLDIFKEPVLKVKSEKYLYEALITWGEKNSEAASDLRPMIDSALKQIRFMTFSSFEFSELCLMNANILTTEEQLQIFMSISRDDPTQLPPNFSVCKSDRKERINLREIHQPGCFGIAGSWFVAQQSVSDIKAEERRAKKHILNVLKQQSAVLIIITSLQCFLTNHRNGGYANGNKFHQKQLALYTNSEFYDCSFVVGKANPTVFKCHKLILAKASQVFANMLFGGFAEGHKDKDDAILIEKNSTPDVFDLAMRFIYGNVKDFQTTPMACKVYEFADRWQIKDLKEAAWMAIKNETQIDQVVNVYEMFQSLGDKERTKHFLEVIIDNTSEVLKSPHWIKVAPSTIDEIYKQITLNVSSEIELFDALLKWGAANSDSPTELRTKIERALQQIRFMTMESDDVAKLCSASVGILSTEETLQIFRSATLRDPEHMPANFSTCDLLRFSHTKFHINFVAVNDAIDVGVNYDSPVSSFTFKVKGDEPVFLTEVELYSLLNEQNVDREADVLCSLNASNSKKILGVAQFNGTIDQFMKALKFHRPIFLQDNTWNGNNDGVSWRIHIRPNSTLHIFRHTNQPLEHKDVSTLRFYFKGKR